MKKTTNNSGKKTTSGDKPEMKNSVTDNDSNVTREERDLLRKTSQSNSEESEDLKRIALDDTDEDNTQLNQRGDLHDMGEDLDVPGAELDDNNEEIGEEDEENNSYSRRD